MGIQSVVPSDQKGVKMKLEGKSILVTGASSGMGKEIVRLFAQEGANVIAMARRMERLEALAEELKDMPGKVIAFQGDVSLQADNEAAIDEALKQFGKLDGLVNNAGIMDDMSAVGNITNERLEQIFQVNVYGPMYLMRKAVQVFIDQGQGGNIINVASVGGLRTVAGAIYGASKAALISLTKNTAFMYQPEGIRCNAIAPGGITTEIQTSMGQPNVSAYERLSKIHAASPEPGTAEDIAQAALFLMSDDSKYISGDVLVIDGGWIAG